MALQSARILPLTDLLTWKYARVPGSTLTVVNLSAAVDTTSYAARDFELQYRDLIVAGALAEVSMAVGDVWGMTVDRLTLPVIPIDVLEASPTDLPASLVFPGPVAHVEPSSIPGDAVESDKDLYGRDVILWETLARAASILEESPIASIASGLVLSEAWSLGEGDDTPDTVNAATPLSVDLFKKSDVGLAERDNLLGAAISRAYEALVDIYSRATRLLVKVDDSELNRDPDQYVLYSDTSTERIWITTPGLSDRSRVVFSKITRQITWISNYYTEQGNAPAALSTSFGSVNDFSVKARVPSRQDCEFYRQKSSQFRVGRYREIPIYNQPDANQDFVGGSASFLGPDDIMLSSNGSYTDLSSGVALDSGVYRFGFMYETRRSVRLFGALNDNVWPLASATAATLNTSGEMTWALKLKAGSYTLRAVFADLTANTPNFGIEIQYRETTPVVVYDGLLLYGYSGGKYVMSPTYVLTSTGEDAVLTFRRTDNSAGQLTIDRIEISPASSDLLDFEMVVTNGTNALPAQIYGVSGRYGCAYFDFNYADSSDVRVGLSELSLGALYIKGYDIKKIELQRETPDTAGYQGWKRGWLENALESVRQSWFTSTKLMMPTFVESGLWTNNSTENWMNTIESVETRLRTAFRLARPTDVGQPALTPIGLSIDEAFAVSLYDPVRLEPVLQALQPWMIRVGVYVAVEDFWPSYYVANAAGIAADFDAISVPQPKLEVRYLGAPTSAIDIEVMQCADGSFAVTLKNVGPAALTIASVAVTGDAMFSITSPPALLILDSGASTTVGMELASGVTQTGAATLVVTSDDPASPTSIPMTGSVTTVSMDSSTLDWEAAVNSAGGILEGDDMCIANNLVVALKAKSYYTQLHHVSPFLGRNLAAAKIPLVSKIPLGIWPYHNTPWQLMGPNNPPGIPVTSEACFDRSVGIGDFASQGSNSAMRLGGLAGWGDAYVNPSSYRPDGYYGTPADIGLCLGYWSTANLPGERLLAGCDEVYSGTKNLYVLRASPTGMRLNKGYDDHRLIEHQVSTTIGKDCLTFIDTGSAGAPASRHVRLLKNGVELYNAVTTSPGTTRGLHLNSNESYTYFQPNPSAALVYTATPDAWCGCLYFCDQNISEANLLDLYQTLRDYLMIPTGRISP